MANKTAHVQTGAEVAAALAPHSGPMLRSRVCWIPEALLKVQILGPHPLHGRSMHRYAALLREAYEAMGAAVEIRSPTSFFSRRARLRALSKLLMYFEELVLFPFALAMTPIDDGTRIHIVDHSDAPWALIPRIRRRSVITCHDLIAVRSAMALIPGHDTRWTGRFYQKLIASGFRRVSSALCVSEATARDVRNVFPRTRAVVVPNPLSAPFRVAVRVGEEEVNAERTQPYVLVVGTDSWRKRRGLAVHAWLEMRDQIPDLSLVLVGPELTPREWADVPSDLAATAPRHDIEVVQGVSELALVELYQNAIALLQMSALEGFCWPVAEANACGTIAICADVPVLREVGPLNVFVQPPFGIQLSTILQAIGSLERRRECQREAQSRYSMPAFIDGLEEVWRRAVEPRYCSTERISTRTGRDQWN